MYLNLCKYGISTRQYNSMLWCALPSPLTIPGFIVVTVIKLSKSAESVQHFTVYNFCSR
jgi:hypothetical protein